MTKQTANWKTNLCDRALIPEARSAIGFSRVLKKPNPLTPFPRREGGTRDSGSPLLAGEGLGERSSTIYFFTLT